MADNYLTFSIYDSNNQIVAYYSGSNGAPNGNDNDYSKEEDDFLYYILKSNETYTVKWAYATKLSTSTAPTKNSTFEIKNYAKMIIRLYADKAYVAYFNVKL